MKVFLVAAFIAGALAEEAATSVDQNPAGTGIGAYGNGLYGGGYATGYSPVAYGGGYAPVAYGAGYAGGLGYAPHYGGHFGGHNAYGSGGYGNGAYGNQIANGYGGFGGIIYNLCSRKVDL